MSRLEMDVLEKQENKTRFNDVASRSHFELTNDQMKVFGIADEITCFPLDTVDSLMIILRCQSS